VYALWLNFFTALRGLLMNPITADATFLVTARGFETFAGAAATFLGLGADFFIESQVQRLLLATIR
jgi:hypothetical protein